MADPSGKSIPCSCCGYDLQGLEASGDCPECGAPIGRSFDGDRLAAADPKWLRSIVRGHRLVWIGMLSTVLCVFTAMGSSITLMLLSMDRPDLASKIDPIMLIVFGCALVGIPISMGIGAIGVYWLTAQEGRETDRESMWSSRLVARWSVLAAIALISVSLSAGFIPIPAGGWAWAGLAARILAIAAVTVAVVALLQRLAGLVRRLPDDDGLGKQVDQATGVFRLTLPVAGVAFFVVPVFAAALPGNIGFAISGVFGCGGLLAVLALLLNSLLLVVIMWQCTIRFRLCLAESEKHVSTVDPAITKT